jgi:hypothetical protein
LWQAQADRPTSRVLPPSAMSRGGEPRSQQNLQDDAVRRASNHRSAQFPIGVDCIFHQTIAAQNRSLRHSLGNTRNPFSAPADAAAPGTDAPAGNDSDPPGRAVFAAIEKVGRNLDSESANRDTHRRAPREKPDRALVARTERRRLGTFALLHNDGSSNFSLILNYDYFFRGQNPRCEVESEK